MLLPVTEEGLASGTGLGAEEAHVSLVGRQVFALNVVVDVGGLAPGPAVQTLPQPCQAKENPLTAQPANISSSTISA